MADSPPMCRCPKCGREAELHWLHEDGASAPPFCIYCNVRYVVIAACSTCNGNGYLDDLDIGDAAGVECPDCDGTGKAKG